MPTNVNFVGRLDADDNTQVSFNLPKTLSLGTVKKSLDNNGLSEAEGCSYLALNTLNQASLLGKASLVVNPSSFSENALYADVPANSTLGDLTFTRATDAWRTDSAGLIQRTPWNLLQYSQTFNNAAWLNTNTTLSVNSAIAPNGTLTAANLVATAGNLQHSIQQNIAISQLSDLTFSCYVKNNGGNFVQLVVGAIGFVNPNPYQNFNLQTGTLAGGSLPSSTITSVGDGWYRITVTAANNTTGTGSFFIIPILNGTTGRAVPFVGDGVNGVYIWGAQLVEGSSPLTYFPTTDRQDVPRIDYSLGGCPTLLMEPQRTNISTGSENMVGSWNVNGATLTANSEISPSGLLNASKITIVSATNGYIFKDIAGTIVSTVYTFSVYIKSATGANVNGGIYAINSANNTSFTATNTWQRFSVTGTASATTSSFYIGGFGSLALGEDIHVWGAQVEAGDSATSYIPTATASVTRNQDVATKVGISSLLGQTEGTVFYEMDIPRTNGLGNQVFANLSNDAGTQLFYNAFINGTGNFVFDIYIAGIYIFTLTTSATAVVGRNRVALVYKAGAYKVFLNGLLVATSTNSTPITNTISRLTLNSGKSTIYHYEFAAFKTALSDTELELLTGNWFDTYAAMAAFYNYTVQ